MAQPSFGVSDVFEQNPDTLDLTFSVFENGNEVKKVKEREGEQILLDVEELEEGIATRIRIHHSTIPTTQAMKALAGKYPLDNDPFRFLRDFPLRTSHRAVVRRKPGGLIGGLNPAVRLSRTRRLEKSRNSK